MPAGLCVLEGTGLQVAGNLALWLGSPLADALALIHWPGIQGIHHPAIHAAVAHAPVAHSRALAVGACFVEVREGVLRWRVEKTGNVPLRVLKLTFDLLLDKF